jgi:hypothetical protein
MSKRMQWLWMKSPLSPVMEHFEACALDTAALKPRCLLRCMGDTIGIWLHDSQSHETEKYGREPCRNHNQEWLCWWGPAAIYPLDCHEREEELHDSQSRETEKCGHVSYRTLNQEWLLARASSNLPDWPKEEVKSHDSVRAVRHKNMVICPVGLRTKNNCSGEGQQQFTRKWNWNRSGSHEAQD